MIPTSRSGTRIYLSLWDVFWAVVSPGLALYLRNVDLLQPDWSAIGYFWTLSAGFSLLAFFALRLQDGMTRDFSVHEALDIAEAVLFAELMTCAVLFTLTRLEGIPRSTPLIHGLLLAGGLVAARVVVRIITRGSDTEPLAYHQRRERIIVIGANRFASSFIQLVNAYAPQQRPVIAVLDDSAAMIGRAISGTQVLGAPHELDAIIGEFAVHGIETDRIVIAGERDFLSPAILHEIERVCRRRQIELSFLPRMIGVTEINPAKTAVASMPVQATSLALRPFFRVKRWIDVIGSLILIVLLSPLLIIAGLLVLLDVGSPVLFWQERVGWKGRSFLIYKFRTLAAPFDSDGIPTIAGRKPSAVGRFLRETRFDELPQLLNVLFGDMSLIGPRPLLPEDQPADRTVRLSVRPGVSGWAQVNGGKLVSKEEKQELDEWYIQNVSLWVDMRIMLMTVKVILKGRISSHETLADAEQVHSKNAHVEHRSADSGVVSR
jgi:lipopolysaccharide/colanic/teichoic acid biosynthesis glycosyltransferase